MLNALRNANRFIKNKIRGFYYTDKGKPKLGSMGITVIVVLAIIIGVIYFTVTSITQSENTTKEQQMQVNKGSYEQETTQMDLETNQKMQGLTKQNFEKLMTKKQLTLKELQLSLITIAEKDLKLSYLKKAFNKYKLTITEISRLMQSLEFTKEQIENAYYYNDEGNLEIRYEYFLEYLKANLSNNGENQNSSPAPKEMIEKNEIIEQKVKKQKENFNQTANKLLKKVEQLEKQQQKTRKKYEKRIEELKKNNQKQVQQLKEKLKEQKKNTSNISKKINQSNKNQDNNNQNDTKTQNNNSSNNNNYNSYTYGSDYSDNTSQNQSNSRQNNNNQSNTTPTQAKVIDNFNTTQSQVIVDNPQEKTKMVTQQKGIKPGTQIKGQLMTGLVSSTRKRNTYIKTIENIKYNDKTVIPKGSIFKGKYVTDYQNRKIFITVNKLLIKNKSVNVNGEVIKDNGKQGFASEVVDPSKVAFWKKFLIGSVGMYLDSLKDTVVVSTNNGQAQTIEDNTMKNKTIDTTKEGLKEVGNQMKQDAQQKRLIITVKNGLKVNIMINQKIPLKYLNK